MPKSRSVVQNLLLFVTLSIGVRFYVYVQQAGSTGMVSVSRPAGVEGFLPIGALLAWKQFFVTGQWDMIHPAAMILFGIAIVLSFGFHKAFCSWICPVGTLSEWLWKSGLRIFSKSFQLPYWLDYPLRSLKYLLLCFFLWVIGMMPTQAIRMFIESPYYKISDVKMLRFFTQMSFTTSLFLSVLIIGSLFIRNFWCRYFCPYGALTGLVGMLGPTRISRDPNRCIDCTQCTNSCPNSISVHLKERVNSPECSACRDCVDICPVADALVLESTIYKLRFRWTSLVLGILVVTFFVIPILGSQYLGYWNTRLSLTEFRELLHMIGTPLLAHP